MSGAGCETARRPFEDDLKSGPNVTADRSYRDVLGVASWCRLKPEVRGRFSVKPAPGGTIRYAGTMRTVELSLMGWLFAQLCRLIGSPLAPYRGKWVPMKIELADDPLLGGVAWSRTYRFPAIRELTVRSTKCRAGEGQFVEHIGRGFRMRLALKEVAGDLWFVSTAYDVCVFGRYLSIPSLLTPGVTTVTHEQLTGDRFRFTLSVDHPWLGRTIYQAGFFYSVSDR